MHLGHQKNYATLIQMFENDQFDRKHALGDTNENFAPEPVISGLRVDTGTIEMKIEMMYSSDSRCQVLIVFLRLKNTRTLEYIYKMMLKNSDKIMEKLYHFSNIQRKKKPQTFK